MGWSSAIKDRRPAAPAMRNINPETAISGARRGAFFRPPIPQAQIDWKRLVTLDFETYYDDEYTLRKLSTSEYIRDPRFKAQMVGIKIGERATRVIPAKNIAKTLTSIDWSSHDLLCHHTQFDGFILSHHYGIQPRRMYDTLSMARGLHNSDIGAGLDEVSVFYGGKGKIKGALEPTKGLLNWPPAIYKKAALYCANDVDECLRIFKRMLPSVPADEIELIHLTVKCFTDPVLHIDVERVLKEKEREIAAKRALLLKVAHKAVGIKLDKKVRDQLPEDVHHEDWAIARAKKMIGSQGFAKLLEDEGVDPPIKLSPAWMKLSAAERIEHVADKWTYAFARTDIEFTELLEHPKQEVKDLVEVRLSVKSNSNVTRAERFLEAGKNGMALPVYYKYAAALSLRWGGGNKMNMQNLKRGGELRKSIKAAKDHVICVADSGQIEARVNAWLWGQHDLLASFKRADAYKAKQILLPKAKQKIAKGEDRDAYCKFASVIYGREVTELDKLERFVGKTAILGLGYQMGGPRLQVTLASGVNGPAVYLDGQVCQKIVNLYRRENYRIKDGWSKCSLIIEDMAAGRTGSWGPISWEKERIWLPNGMCLKYPGLRNKAIVARVTNVLEDSDEEVHDEWVYSRKGQESKIYGGLLCENIVQALARLIVGWQMLQIARTGTRVVMTTHDEVVSHVRAVLGPKVFENMVKTMRIPPGWCDDIPLNAEGGFDVVYSK